MRIGRVLTISALLSGVLTTGVVAHKGATGVVKERMDQMGTIAESMKAMGAMFKGAEAYDSAAVEAFSRKIATFGGDQLIAVFPEGSLDHPSEARPEVWSNWDRFVELAREMETAALKLADGATNQRDEGSATSPDALFRDLAATCKSCHQDFRIEK